ncbi:hypothetical protein LTR56_026392, partial [Elasticomyces elasticus]
MAQTVCMFSKSKPPFAPSAASSSMRMSLSPGYPGWWRVTLLWTCSAAVPPVETASRGGIVMLGVIIRVVHRSVVHPTPVDKTKC